MNDTTILSSESDRTALKAMLVEITNSLSKIDAEREQIGETVSAAESKFSIKKKVVRKLATTMYKHNYADLQAENNHFELLYEQLVEGKKSS